MGVPYCAPAELSRLPVAIITTVTGSSISGLASSGTWGCFDEFNRLVPEVLSVCSLQFKAVTDGLKAHAASSLHNNGEDHSSPTIVVEDDRVNLDPGCGVFITMNPGYLGRSELPEGLKVKVVDPLS